jgi:formimidoylglutamate deiminase
VSPTTLPGFVNAHCHAFQRALRGSVHGRDFWAWRKAMVALAQGLSAQDIRTEYAAVYREMLQAGYTAVGEFHYLGFDSAIAAAEAADEAGIEFTLLYAAYAVEPFAQPSVRHYLRDVEELRRRGIRVGVAPHSVRACPPDWLDEIGRYAEHDGLVLHVHAAEQALEVKTTTTKWGHGPIYHLAEHGCLGPQTTIVHATHADDYELDLIRDAGARICICPTTEASLGDGFAPIDRICDRRIPVCIGSDSNVRIDPLEELRELEGIARRWLERRNVISVDRLLAFGSDEGAGALGLESWPGIVVDTAHPSLAGIDDADLLPALVFGCSAEVLSAEA